MVLHTLNQCGTALESCLRALGPGDSLLLIEDAVYAACSGHEQQALLQACPAVVHALEEDVSARGIRERIDNNVQLSNYKGFVALVANSSNVVSWY